VTAPDAAQQAILADEQAAVLDKQNFGRADARALSTAQTLCRVN